MNITVTDIAQTRLNDLIGARATSTEQAIRIFTAAGGCGCSGPRFGMGLDEASDGDAVVKIGALTFVVDAGAALRAAAARGGGCDFGGLRG